MLALVRPWASTTALPRFTCVGAPTAAMNPIPFTTLACLAFWMIVGWIVAELVL
jgi:hypothetical protein